PENTIVSFERALADGADGVEFDVRLASDGVPILLHDPDLRRTGLREGLVANLSSSELTRIDAGSWFNLKFPSAANPAYTQATIPTLADSFHFFKHRNCLLYVELKCAPHESRDIAQATIELIHEHGFTHRVVVKSFLLEAIKDVKLLDKTIRTAALFDQKITRPVVFKSRLLERAIDSGADEISLHYTLVSGRIVRRATERGLETVVWTVDNPLWVERARRRGVRALITNNPALLTRARS
ncbi:MAG TPA: glycerophosphodiester phosphodiesterase family protein, partial [Pyrinomonadaceae bacterium]|nr:glycerophosphodiester phosphodiesterase family protein [Pyrinomonadaceae bacterium]